jgi:hypothetical protein
LCPRWPSAGAQLCKHVCVKMLLETRQWWYRNCSHFRKWVISLITLTLAIDNNKLCLRAVANTKVEQQVQVINEKQVQVIYKRNKGLGTFRRQVFTKQ